MYKKLVFQSLIFMMTCLFIFPLGTQAEDGRVSYSVEAIIPENQIDLKQSYFDLNMKPNQSQQLGVVIHNNEREDITVRLAVHNATTNSNGLVVYEYKEELDPSLEVPLTDILSFSEGEVVLPAGESKTVYADLRMPKEEFDGTILGGFHFEKVSKEKGFSEGVSIKNKYAYVIGVQLSENNIEISPDLHLISIRPDLVNHRTAVIVNIQNSEPTLMKDMSIHARIYKKGKKEVFKEKNQKQINMAPNSSMNLLIDWKNEPLEPGTYLLEMEAFHEEEVWKWKEEFVIEKKRAKDLNKDAVELEKSDKLWMWFLLGIGALVMIIVILLIYIRKLKGEKDEREI